MNFKQFAFIILSAGLFTIGSCGKEDTGGKASSAPDIGRLMAGISPDSIRQNIHTLVGFHTRHTMSDTASDHRGIGAARRWIYGKFREYSRRNSNRLTVSYDRYTEEGARRITEPTEIVNVVAVLPGTQLESKDRIYLVSGHYDSRVSSVLDDTSFAPGANDDASGTAAVLELARVMSAYEFDATIVFMTVAGEEQGLLGAEHFAKQARKKQLNIEAMFTNDIIGSPVAEDGTVHDGTVRLFAEGIPPRRQLNREQRIMLATGGENDTPARQLARYIHDISKTYMNRFKVNIIYRKDRYLRGGDHSAFLEQGYPAVRFSEPHENYRHQHQDVRVENGVQYGDLPEFVDVGYVAKVTRLNAASLASLANAPAVPGKVGVDIGSLSNNTTLRWAPNSEPDLKGYEVVWRHTNRPFWEFSRFVGDTTGFTIKGISKDNYIFGIRSVDQFGFKSPAVYPMPYR